MSTLLADLSEAAGFMIVSAINGYENGNFIVTVKDAEGRSEQIIAVEGDGWQPVIDAVADRWATPEDPPAEP